MDWARSSAAAARVDLPTYPFRPDRYWPEGFHGANGDLRLSGLHSAEHPLLGAGVALPESGGFLFTGALSPQLQPWLADHTVERHDRVPGSRVRRTGRAGGRRGRLRPASTS